MTGRGIALGGGALALVAVAAAATLGLGGRGATGPAPERTGPAATAVVTRQTLVRSVTLTGELGYGPAVPLASTAAGTVTWLPEVGATVRRGEAVLRADELPVLLLYGFLPMYRPLAVGVKGSDVRQFERNLAALGYDGFTVDEEFSAATAAAVKRWQKQLELPETGAVERERVTYAPGAIRVAEHLVRPGAAAAAEVLAFTGTTRVATVSAGAGEAAWASKGVAVTVSLPTGGSVAGTVSSVGPVSTAQDGAGDAAAAVEVTIAIADQKGLGALAGAPVEVRYEAERADDVLTVPVDALLALAEGGYGVELDGAAGTRVVAVRVGLFADGRVAVTGDGLAEGARVGVPE
ncbi:peptidoglycan-binding protein [Phytohabitans houttuyneae]|uniref:Peptidoglycan-binding protein n=1 Tax=Phytohabitans houttuyneae TaxID=1076126 RepID=A0A6V8KGC1_9ACTN|nr:peptidoglycan-binding protein [Phytohabitans houttuyneae]GFJ82854.1 peptidoglycan-binding protein [Phytohabitans houttuyneae]